MTKVELFSEELRDISAYFKALGHPARLLILNYLAETKVCMTGDVTNELPLSRTTVKQHLMELKKAGLISGEVEGVKINYCLNMVKITEVVEKINKYFENIECCKNENCN